MKIRLLSKLFSKKKKEENTRIDGFYIDKNIIREQSKSVPKFPPDRIEIH